MYGTVNVMICDVMIVLYDWCDYLIISEMMRSYLDDMCGPSCGGLEDLAKVGARGNNNVYTL